MDFGIGLFFFAIWQQRKNLFLNKFGTFWNLVDNPAAIEEEKRALIKKKKYHLSLPFLELVLL